MGKRGPKPKENPLSVRVQFRISTDTMAAYEALAEVLDVPTYHLMRQALDESAGLMLTMTTAFGQVKGGEPVKGIELYRKMLDSFGPQLEVQQGVTDAWLQQALDGSRKVVGAADPSEEGAGRASNTSR